MPQARRLPARWPPGRGRLRAGALALALAAAPALGIVGTAAEIPAEIPVGADRPQFMILAFAVPQVGGVPHSPHFKGVLSREVPREIGRRMAGLIAADTRFFALRTTAGGKPRFVVPERLSPGAEVLRIARNGNAAFLLDGVVSATDTLRVRVRLYEVATGRPLWQSVYEKPTAQAGRLLGGAARDIALALPDNLGEAARGASVPAHEPSWAALLAYLEGEGLRFSRKSRVAAGPPGAIRDAFLESVRLDPAYDPPRDALLEEVYAELRSGTMGADAPLAALARLVALRPAAASYAALARGQALASRVDAAYASWQKSIEMDPAFVEGWLQVARGRAARGNYPGTVAALERAAALGFPSPQKNARLKRDLGGVYLEGGDVDKAIAVLEASAKENPSDPVTYERLGSAYLTKSKTEPNAGRAWYDRAQEAHRTASRLREGPGKTETQPGKDGPARRDDA